MASLGSTSNGASSNGGSASSNKELEEGDFDTLLSTIPDSLPKKNGPHVLDTSERSFATPKLGLCEPDLAEGFSWQRKEPPRPGQFSQRPQRPSHPPTHETRRAEPPRPVASSGMPPLQPSSPVHKGNKSPAAPLDLHELSFNDNEESSAARPTKFDTPRGIFGKSIVTPVSAMPRDQCHIKKQDHQPPGSVHSDSPRGDKGLLLQPKLLHEYSTETSVRQGPTSPGQLSSLNSQNRDATSSPFSHGSPRNRHNSKSEKDEISLLGGLPSQFHKRLTPVARQNSPGSQCGDLEGVVVYRSPARPRNMHRSMPTRPLTSQLPGRQGDALPRPPSQTSNISRRRARVEKSKTQPVKHRSSRPQDQREKALLLAQYCNEFIRETEDEKQQVIRKAQSLQDELGQQECKLKEYRQLMADRDDRLQQIEDRCRELELKDNDLSEDKQRLGDEVQKLREQLDASQKRSSGIGEKYRVYRAKLNEAIKEQQDLFLQSQSFCNETKQELEKERSLRLLDADAMREAMETSRQKHDKVKKSLDQLRNEAEHDIVKKNSLISTLEAQVAEYGRELAREKDVSTDLRTQIDAQVSAQSFSDSIGPKLDVVHEFCVQRDERDQAQAKAMGGLEARLDQISHQVRDAQSSELNDTKMKAHFNELEKKVTASVLNKILGAIPTQDSVQASVSQLKQVLQTEIAQLADGIRQRDANFTQQHGQADETSHESMHLITAMHADLKKVQEACEQTQQECRESAVRKDMAERDARIADSEELSKQLTERNETIGELQRQLQLTAEDYAAKLEEINAGAVFDETKVQTLMKDALSELGDKLTGGVEVEHNRAHERLAEIEASNATLRRELDEAKQKLEKVGSFTEDDVDRLQCNLRDEKSTVAELKQKVQQLQTSAGNMEKLRKRWMQDIKSAGLLRSQLESLSSRLPQLDSIGTQMRQAMEANGLLQQTARYLSTERVWVQRQLSSRPAVPGPDLVRPKSPQLGIPDSCAQESGVVEEIEVPDSQVNARLPASSASSQSELSQRRVTVHSPIPATESSLPPPSVEQEQQLRRVAGKPRSILKICSAPLTGLRESESQGVSKTTHQSQYNRIVEGGMSSAASKVNGVIQQIRSGFIHPRRVPGDWTFPTLEDFEKSNQPKQMGQCSGAGEKHQRGDGEPDEHAKDSEAKKQKLGVATLANRSSGSSVELAARGGPTMGSRARPVRQIWKRYACDNTEQTEEN